MSKFSFGKTHNRQHDEFLELCAISTSGEMTELERRRLEAHLPQCRECQEAMRQFDAVVDEAIPTIAAECVEQPEASADNSWSQEEALSKLLSGIRLGPEPKEEWQRHITPAQSVAFASSDTWRSLFMLYAAGILLFTAMGIALYRVGMMNGTRLGAIASDKEKRSDPSFDQHLNEASRNPWQLNRNYRNETDQLSNFADLQVQSAQLKQLKQQRQQLQTDLRDSESGRQRLSREQSDLANKNQIASAQIAALEEKLHSAEMQASQQSARTSSLHSQVSELQQSLDEKNKTVDEQQELLAHDRDIRELMGARDLYIAEVYDVEKNGQTRKAFGRVFYTKGKSLVFYAYDLDQQKRLKNANTFQYGVAEALIGGRP